MPVVPQKLTGWLNFGHANDNNERACFVYQNYNRLKRILSPKHRVASPNPEPFHRPPFSFVGTPAWQAPRVRAYFLQTLYKCRFNGKRGVDRSTTLMDFWVALTIRQSIIKYRISIPDWLDYLFKYFTGIILVDSTWWWMESRESSWWHTSTAERVIVPQGRPLLPNSFECLFCGHVRTFLGIAPIAQALARSCSLSVVSSLVNE